MIKIENFSIDPLDVSFEPLAGSKLSNLLRLLAENRFRISLIGFPRIVYSAFMSSVLAPLDFYEKNWFKRKAEQINIKKHPIFILGHWRTGTTYLHNLLSQDSQFGYPTTFQTVTPAVCLKFEKIIKPIVESSLPETRPQDNVKIGADLPQEEEYAIGNLSPYSFYNGWCFPKNMERYNNYVDMRNVSLDSIEEFKKIYLYFLKKVSLYHNGKRLLLKNPSNTARIKLLLEMFPESKFVHIHRNPYHVFLSMKRNIEKEMTLYCVQKPFNWEKIEQSMVDMYKRMYLKYFEEKKLIPKENFVEIKYESFIEDPLCELEKIYKEFDLGDFSKVESVFKKYIESQGSVKTSSYEIDGDLKKKIYNYFHETIDLWGYDV